MKDFISENKYNILIVLSIILFLSSFYFYDNSTVVSKSRMTPICKSFPPINPIINNNAKITYHKLQNGMKIVIIDDVLKNINEITSERMKNYFATLGCDGSNANYPGKQYPLRLNNNNFLKDLKGLLKEHHQFQKTKCISENMEYSVGNEFKPQSPYTTNPHCDNEHEGLYACMIYLNKDDDCYGGTSIFRSKILNSMMFPKIKGGLNSNTYNEIADKIYHNHEPGYNIIEGQKYNDKEWELIKHMKMKYNRMVVYDACLFHSMDLDTFENFKDKNRYTLNFWVDILPFCRRDHMMSNPEYLLEDKLINEKAFEEVMEKPDHDPIEIYLKHIN